MIQCMAMALVMIFTQGQAQAKTTGQAEQLQKHITTYTLRYEKIRVLLAQDDLNASKKEAVLMRKDLAAVITQVSHTPSVQAQFQAISEASLQMNQSQTADEQRKAFGDVSKAIITLLNQYKGLQKGWHIFMCPMAQGYSKWIQASADMANPYMGKRMLKCGGKTQWTP